MKKTFLFCIVIFVCVFFTSNSYAQLDPQFSAKMFTKQLINPASVGESELANAFGNWRKQWKNVGPVTYAAYVDTPIKGVKRNHGAGLSIISDEAGLFKNTSVNFAYSHKQILWDGRLSIGVQGSFLNMVFDGGGVEELPSSPYHTGSGYPSYNTETSGIKFDMALGAHYSKDNYYGGFSFTHLTRPTLELQETGTYVYFNRTVNLYGGYDFKLRSMPDLLFKSSIFVKTDGKLTQFDVNCNAWYKNSIFAGMSYRFQDAIAVMAGMKLKSGILVGGVYDMTTSNMAFGGFGSTEIFFKYEFSLSLNSKTNKYKSIRIL